MPISVVICEGCLGQHRWLEGMAAHERLRTARGALLTRAVCAKCSQPLQPPTEAMAVIRWDGRYEMPPGPWEETVIVWITPQRVEPPKPRGGGGPER